MVCKTVSAAQVCKDSRIAAQGVQPLVRNAVTQNNPDIQMPGLFAPQDAHTGITPYRSAPLVPKGFPHITANRYLIRYCKW